MMRGFIHFAPYLTFLKPTSHDNNGMYPLREVLTSLFEQIIRIIIFFFKLVVYIIILVGVIICIYNPEFVLRYLNLKDFEPVTRLISVVMLGAVTSLMTYDFLMYFLPRGLTKLSSIEKELNEYKKHYTIISKENIELKKEIENCRKRFDSVSVENVQLKKENENLQIQIIRIKDELYKYRTELENCQSQYHYYSSLLQQLKLENDSLKNQLLASRNLIENLQMDRNRLLEELENTRKRFQQEIERIKFELNPPRPQVISMYNDLLRKISGIRGHLDTTLVDKFLIAARTQIEQGSTLKASIILELVSALVEDDEMLSRFRRLFMIGFASPYSPKPI